MVVDNIEKMLGILYISREICNMLLNIAIIRVVKCITFHFKRKKIQTRTHFRENDKISLNTSLQFCTISCIYREKYLLLTGEYKISWCA